MLQDRGPELAAVVGLFLALSWLFTSLRVYVKLRLNKSWGSDDTLLMISLVFFTTYCSCSATGVYYGTGQHITAIPPASIPKALYNWWLCELFYTLTTFTLRLSIAAFFLRLCINRVHTYIIIGTIAMVGIFSTFYFFLVLFQCSPVSYFWGQYGGETGRCINPAAVPIASITHSVVSFTADWIFGLLPILLLYHLKMNLRTKISVALLLSLGLLAGIAAMIRIPYIKILALTDDFLYATTDVAIWSTIEPGLGIIAFSGATFRPLFRSFYNSTINNSSSNNPTTPARAAAAGTRRSRTIRTTTTTTTITTTITSQNRRSGGSSSSSMFGLIGGKVAAAAANRDGYVINDGDQQMLDLEPTYHQHNHKTPFSTACEEPEVEGVGDVDVLLSVPTRVQVVKGDGRTRYEGEGDGVVQVDV